MHKNDPFVKKTKKRDFEGLTEVEICLIQSCINLEKSARVRAEYKLGSVELLIA